MTLRFVACVCSLIAVLNLLGLTSSRAESPVVEDMLGIMKDRGLIDADEYSSLRARNTAYESEQRSFLERFEFSGDFRARHESFWYDEDALGAEARDRYRIRYRLRLNGRAEVNDWLSVAFQLATGEDHNSATHTLGGNATGETGEFDAHGVVLRQGYLDAHYPVNGVRQRLMFGKMPNPFRWKVGKDFLWDADISPEGVGVKLAASPSDDLKLFANLGYFIIDEEAGRKDPHFFGLQLGGEKRINDRLALGGRGTFYNFRSLESNFITRNANNGNLAGGVEGNDNQISVAETTIYGRYTGLDRWPLLLYGTYVKNFDAESIVGAGKEDQALGVGLEAGTPTEIAQVGFAYWKFEANAFPANFTDSVLFDGFTNRDGWALYGKKRLLKNTDIKFEFFVADELEDDPVYFSGLPPTSVGRSDRIRFRTDVEVKF